jgi:hypothetical protein
VRKSERERKRERERERGAERGEVRPLASFASLLLFKNISNTCF